MKYLYGHNSPETAYLVEDYPYGFRLRTQIRYWIETTKNGDRFVSQTLNPKTGKWNKEKKSTYTEVGIMIQRENGYIGWIGFSHWEDEAKLNEWLADKDQTQFNEGQLLQIKKLRAIFKTREHITMEIVNTTFQTQEERDAHDKEQAEVSKKMGQIYSYYMSKS